MTINSIILNDYGHYREFLEQLKRTAFSPIILNPKKNNNRFLLGEVAVSHPTITENISLIAEQNVTVRSHFGFKLRALHLGAEPVFRFDSDGPSHRNDLDSIPLAERQVTTPHFHRYDNGGRMLAYKTQVLNDAAQVAAIKGDINLGLAHFSQESNVRCPENNFPEVRDHNGPLLVAPDDSDPLAGKDFSQ